MWYKNAALVAHQDAVTSLQKGGGDQHLQTGL